MLDMGTLGTAMPETRFKSIVIQSFFGLIRVTEMVLQLKSCNTGINPVSV